jgi:hypothetical protein
MQPPPAPPGRWRPGGHRTRDRCTGISARNRRCRLTRSATPRCVPAGCDPARRGAASRGAPPVSHMQHPGLLQHRHRTAQRRLLGHHLPRTPLPQRARPRPGRTHIQRLATKARAVDRHRHRAGTTHALRSSATRLRDPGPAQCRRPRVPPLPRPESARAQAGRDPAAPRDTARASLSLPDSRSCIPAPTDRDGQPCRCAGLHTDQAAIRALAQTSVTSQNVTGFFVTAAPDRRLGAGSCWICQPWPMPRFTSSACLDRPS